MRHKKLFILISFGWFSVAHAQTVTKDIKLTKGKAKVTFASIASLLALSSLAIPTLTFARNTSHHAVHSGSTFTSDEMSLLYEACQQSGGTVSMNGNVFSCVKTGISNVSPPDTQSSNYAPAPSTPKGKYRGASLADAQGGDATGDITKMHTIEKVVPLIRVGHTTRAEIVSALKEPVSSQFDSNGMETTVFAEDVAFWKTGGIGQLFTKRAGVKKTLMVMFKNGRVSYFNVGDRR